LTTNISRVYSREEWKNQSMTEGNRIYRARERLETACTVAAILCKESGPTPANDISTIMAMVNNPGNQTQTNVAGNPSQGQRSTAQVSLNNASTTMSRRCGVVAYYMVSRRCVNSNHSKHHNISSVWYAHANSCCHAELGSHTDTCGVNNTSHILEYMGKVAKVSGFSKEF
jgi:ribosomal protein L37E